MNEEHQRLLDEAIRERPSTFDDYLQPFLKSFAERSQKFVQYQKLTDAQLRQLQLSSSPMDIDSFLFIGTHNNIFQEEPFKTFWKGYQMASPFRFCRRNEIHSNSLKGIFTVGKINHFSIGIPYQQNVQRNDEKLFIESDETVDQQHINSLIDHFPETSQLPIDQFVSLLTCLKEKPIAVFACGMKLPLSDFKLDFKILIEKGTVEIALATEFSRPGEFVCCSYPSDAIGKYYSNFLSSTGCNFQCKVTKDFQRKGYAVFRTTLYNTVQHIKKFAFEKLVFRKFKTNKHSTIIDHLQLGMQPIIQSMRSMLECIKGTKLRQEFYIQLSTNDCIDNFFEFTKFIISDVTICSCNEDDLLSKLKIVFQNFLYLESIVSSSCECNELLLLIIYYKLFTGFFSLAIMSASFVAGNFGFGFSTGWYEIDTRKLTPKFFSDCSVGQIVNMLYEIIECDVYNNHVMSYFVFLYHKLELQTTEQFINSAKLICCIEEYLVNCSERSIAKLQCEKEMCLTFREYLVLIGVKIERSYVNVFKTKSWNLAKSLLQNSVIFEEVEKRVVLKRVSFFADKTLYIIKNPSIANILKQPLTLETVFEFVREFKKYFISNCDMNQLSSSFPQAKFVTFIHKFYLSYNDFIESSKGRSNFSVELSSSIDNDLKYRIFFAHAPIADTGNALEFYKNCIPFCFTDITWFFKFIGYAIIHYDFPNDVKSSDKVLKNYSCSLNKNLKMRVKYSGRHLSLFLGCYQTDSCAQEVVQSKEYIRRYQPAHIKIIKALAVQDRFHFCLLNADLMLPLDVNVPEIHGVSTSLDSIDELIRRRKDRLLHDLVVHANGDRSQVNCPDLELANNELIFGDNVHTAPSAIQEENLLDNSFGGEFSPILSNDLHNNPLENECNIFINSNNVDPELSIGESLMNEVIHSQVAPSNNGFNFPTTQSLVSQGLISHNVPSPLLAAVALNESTNDRLSSSILPPALEPTQPIAALSSRFILENGTIDMQEIIADVRPLRRYRDDLLSMPFKVEHFSEKRFKKTAIALEELLAIQPETAEFICDILKSKLN